MDADDDPLRELAALAVIFLLTYVIAGVAGVAAALQRAGAVQ